MPAQRLLLPRSAPSAVGVSSRAVGAFLDRLAELSVECHSLVVVRRGQVVAEGWWAPYSAQRPHLLYSLTKSVTALAVGLAVADGLLATDDLVVDLLPEHVPADASAQARRITVHHLLTMTAGHPRNSLEEAWRREPGDLVRGFLGLPFDAPEGTRHVYDDATAFLLARIVERVTGRGLAEFVDERLFGPMGVGPAEWDRVRGGAVFGFQGLHLTTEAVAALGELLLRGGSWGGRQLVPRAWVELATRRHIDSEPFIEGADDPDFACGYGYQFWRSRHGFHANGAYGQQCVVVPAHDLVVAVTAQGRSQTVFDALWEFLLPGLAPLEGPDGPDTAAGPDRLDTADGPEQDALLAERLRRLSLPLVPGTAEPGRAARAKLDAAAAESALPDGTQAAVEPVDGGWRVSLGPLPDTGTVLDFEVGHGGWRESAPLGRPVVAAGGWQDGRFHADLYVITTPHRVRLTLDPAAGTATALWSTPPLTGPRLELHLRAPLLTRPDVC
ncbi:MULTISPECIES: serine hydrolase domain-containing protein [Kitasatospora]|uniref:Putative peptidase S12 family protein n=1 Tax=Kitasatospora setae (strain ATCC 33774 / DSM 43861 / JCM 3304 / KCC A-0304 / NBRC 14216 / KM-6054) TaxID=452652 RepID=E4NJ13_KITSK|nr:MULTISPECIES: serine hydrolase domain-containing protein [Kitasatospora]BAJ32961.1 putative peptidase S12 family protein [Kitasatospora setae KM-6054]